MAARKSIQAGSLNGPVTLDEDSNHGSESISLYALWADVSAHITQDAYDSMVCLSVGSAYRNTQSY